MFSEKTVRELQTLVDSGTLQQIIATRTILSILEPDMNDLTVKDHFKTRIIDNLRKVFPISTWKASMLVELVVEIEENESLEMIGGLGGSKPKTLAQLVNFHIG